MMCGRCYANGPTFPATCKENPEDNMTQGMYHCPDCGAMILARYPHPELCQLCNNRTHPDYDRKK